MNTVTRFLSKREKKHKDHSHEPHVHKDLYRIFHLDDSASSIRRKLDRDEEKKIKTVLQRLEQHNITDLKDAQVEYALRSKASDGDCDKAFELLLLFQDALHGVVRPLDMEMKLLGAENRENVTCYIDSLLFAMFARTDSFDTMLTAERDGDLRRLVTLLRLWVNMLRTGKLITVDITKHMQDALGACGWEEASLLRQQDVSEAFAFITGKLNLPLLTLKMDVYHTGKEDKDDHRIVRERLLEVAIPPPPTDGSAVKLEDCLESYFNNKIEVKRHLQRRNTLQSVRASDIKKVNVAQVEHLELRSNSPSRTLDRHFFPRDTNDLAASIFSQRHVDVGELVEKRTRDDMLLNSRTRSGTIRREVLMPAWQFFSLIPWYTQNRPQNDEQVVAHLSTKRPVLGICLKRYSMTPEGVGTRLDTYIDIPLEIGLPHFISDSNGDSSYEPSFTNFKLSLQSVICHRGKSLDAGHYISLVRGPPSGAAWLRFDDLARERVTPVDMPEALRAECPYLLFYQVVPIDANGAWIEDPPAYETLKHTFAGTNGTAVPQDAVTDTTESAVDTASESSGPVGGLTVVVASASAPDTSSPTERGLLSPGKNSSAPESPSARAEQPGEAGVRPYSLDLGHLVANNLSERRVSIGFTDGPSPAETPDSGAGTPSEERTSFLGVGTRAGRGWRRARSGQRARSGTREGGMWKLSKKSKENGDVAVEDGEDGDVGGGKEKGVRRGRSLMHPKKVLKSGSFSYGSGNGSGGELERQCVVM
ncbi:cysteine proteinase [Trichodelitschia bisporula]|uniref:ubiquitinyl hydrolase 1 n=1 Tax=Trichodelitschia bisporula TaxID=703511 RepID=A0A6G1I8Z8_9PEZI|nr:cysteine proteinase [Trichodelitschia bisporula]